MFEPQTSATTKNIGGFDSSLWLEVRDLEGCSCFCLFDALTYLKFQHIEGTFCFCVYNI
jgi:hypothetical protein